MCVMLESNQLPIVWIEFAVSIPKKENHRRCCGLCLERVARIELANKPWQGFRLPLHHTRIEYIIYEFLIHVNWCDWPESNRHAITAADFKSAVATDYTTVANWSGVKESNLY